MFQKTGERRKGEEESMRERGRGGEERRIRGEERRTAEERGVKEESRGRRSGEEESRGEQRGGEERLFPLSCFVFYCGGFRDAKHRSPIHKHDPISMSMA